MIQMMNSISSKIFSIKPSTLSILLVVTFLLLALIAFSPPTPFSVKSLPLNSLNYVLLFALETGYMERNKDRGMETLQTVEQRFFNRQLHWFLLKCCSSSSGE